jgi:hypothetical protein
VAVDEKRELLPKRPKTKEIALEGRRHVEVRELYGKNWPEKAWPNGMRQ